MKEEYNSYGQPFIGKFVPGQTLAGRKVYRVNPATIDSPETEGTDLVFTIDSDREIWVQWIGPADPTDDMTILCRPVGGRFVAGVGKPVPPEQNVITIPSCFCTSIPMTLNMDSVNPSCNGGMFQSCTLQWGDTPAEYAALSLGSQCFLSVQSFVDTNGDTFRYYFTCNLGQFTLSRVYATSIFGSPFRDSVRYSWPIGATGNSCKPFSMTNGQIYLGGDFSCQINITDGRT